MLSKAFQDVELLLLKDRDIKPDGSSTSMEDRARWLAKQPVTNRMLLRRELENYLFDYEIVQKRGIQMTADEYAAFIGDILNDDVKSKTGELMNRLGLHTGLSAANFKRQLAALVTRETAVYKELVTCIFPPTVADSGSQAPPGHAS